MRLLSVSHETLLEVRNLSKAFPGVKALNNVNIVIRKGEVHAICGENGAGKSTLIKVLGGVYKHGSYDGSISLNGTPLRLRNVKDAEDKGIVCIQQELALVPELSVAENIFLRNQPNRFGVVTWPKMFKNARTLIDSIGISTESATGIPVAAKVKSLSVQKRQIVEILKALAKEASLLILDEPTASLTEEEVASLLQIVSVLREKGITCIYISHKLGEVMKVADTVTVLRDGKSIITESVARLSKEAIIRYMVGRPLDKLFPREKRIAGEVTFEIRDYSVSDPLRPKKKLLNKINLKARRNEILGISGLMGSGRTELFLSIAGLLPAKAEGDVYLNGKAVNFRSARESLESGLVIVTEDRKKYGLVLGMNIMENSTMSILKDISSVGVLNRNEEIRRTNSAVEYFRIKMSGLTSKVGNLSGGNQQKVVLGRSMLCKPKVIVLDEPTRGIDVGAKFDIYKLINQLTRDGVTVIMISSDLEEILGMSDRIVVFGEGVVRGEVVHAKATQEAILAMSVTGEG